jgi:hypothetical protein
MNNSISKLTNSFFILAAVFIVSGFFVANSVLAAPEEKSVLVTGLLPGVLNVLSFGISELWLSVMVWILVLIVLAVIVIYFVKKIRRKKV